MQSHFNKVLFSETCNFVQAYDKYLKQSLVEAANAQGRPEWAGPPSNAGEYNSKPQNTGFFKDGGDYDSDYGRFFLQWYSQTLIDHGDRVLSLANKAFRGTKIAAKVRTVAFLFLSAFLHLTFKTPVLKRLIQCFRLLFLRFSECKWMIIRVALSTYLKCSRSE